MTRRLTLLSLACIQVGQILNAQLIRQIEFSVYGQYPLRNLAYYPNNQVADPAASQAQVGTSIQSHPLSRMGPYYFEGSNHIVFYDQHSSEPMARATLPHTSNKWLLIFIRNPKHPEARQTQPQFLIYPFDDSHKNFTMNAVTFVNLSGQQLDGFINNKRVTIKQGSCDKFPAAENLPINLWVRGVGDQQLLPAAAKTFSLKMNHRNLMILFPPALKGSSDLDLRLLSAPRTGTPVATTPLRQSP